MRLRHALLLLTMIPLPYSSGDAAEKPDQFAAAYATAKTEVERRSVCIEAIDTGVVRMGISIDVVKKIFGRDFEDMGADSGSNRLAIVHFTPTLRSTNKLVSHFPRGWYLSLSYTPGGALLTYHLSNVGKESAMKIPPSERSKVGKRDVGLPIPNVTPDNSKEKK